MTTLDLRFRASGLVFEGYPASAAPPAVRAAAEELFLAFAEMSVEDFRASIDAKDTLMLVRDGERVVGTLAAKWHGVPHPATGRLHHVLTVHHTAILPEYRGRNIVQHSGLKLLLRHRRRHPLAPTWWLFDTFSFRSYLGMSRNFPFSWPTPRRPVTPPGPAALVDALLRKEAGPRWDPQAGIVRWTGRRLRDDEHPSPERIASDPDVAFFVARNPGHREGHCLACVASLSWTNLALAAWNSFVARPLRR